MKFAGGKFRAFRLPMNRFLRTAFLGVACFSALNAALFGGYLHLADLPLLRAKTFWLLVAGALFFLFGAWRFSLQVKFKIFLFIFALLIVEMLLQTASWLGALPAVNTKE